MASSAAQSLNTERDPAEGGSGERSEIAEFKHWYPDWATFKFRRTIAYWISVMFIEGSVLFLIGAAFSILIKTTGKDKVYMQPIVDFPYFCGSLCFTVGSVLGVIEVLNVDNHGKIVLCPSPRVLRKVFHSVDWKAFAGYSSYTIGASFYNINCTAGFFKLTEAEEMGLVDVPAVLGAFFLLVGALIECGQNNFFRPVCTIVWWLCFANVLGASLFLVAGIGMMAGATGDAALWSIDVAYLAGSAAYLLGGVLSLYMWKSEHYGLGFIPELNKGERAEDSALDELDMHSQYGCGRASVYQLPWLLLYCVQASISCVILGLSEWYVSDVQKIKEAGEGIGGFLLAHGVLLLGSVIHHVPTRNPHKALILFMRFVLLWYFAMSIFSLVEKVKW